MAKVAIIASAFCLALLVGAYLALTYQPTEDISASNSLIPPEPSPDTTPIPDSSGSFSTVPMPPAQALPLMPPPASPPLAAIPQGQPIPYQQAPLPQGIAPQAAPPTPPQPPSYQRLQILSCAGRRDNANFRQAPSLHPTAILGIVGHGDFVELTGRTVYGDGEVWHEVIAPALYPSAEPGAQNRLEPGQIGWIASCFVSG